MVASGRNLVVPLLAAAVGITIALTVGNLLSNLEEQVTESEFQLDAQGVHRTVEREIATAEETVFALRAFFAGSNDVNKEEFFKFTEQIRPKHKEIEGFVWAAESAKNPGSYPIEFVEPPEAATLGDDLAIAPGRRDAIDGATPSGDLSGTRPIDGFILVLARARSGKQHGLVAARIRIATVAHQAITQFAGKGLELSIVDSNDPKPVRLYGEFSPESGDQRHFVMVGRRQLDVYVRAGPRYRERRHTFAPLIVMLAILGATALAVGYVWILQTRTRRIARLVDQRTARIREFTRFQKAILESAEYAIFAFDTAGTVLSMNPAAERMLQYRANDVISRKSVEVFFDTAVLRGRVSTEKVESGRDLLVLHAGRGVTDPWMFRRSDGIVFPGSLSVSALHDDANSVTGYLAMAQDITERIQAEEALRSAKAQAEDASRTKSRFLANMSHELRTPLTAILGYAEMLGEDAEAAGATQSSRDLGRIQDAGRHLLLLIDDVLDLSKVEAGRMDLQPESIDLPTLMEDIATTVRSIAESRGNKVEVRSVEGTVKADPTRLRQVLLNLAANAARFTEEGIIVLEAEREKDGVLFRVRDSGIGMTEEQLARVFSPFEQAEQSTAVKHGGTGLGLAIARQFTDLMGGDLRVKSKPGEGSEFCVWIPGAPA